MDRVQSGKFASYCREMYSLKIEQQGMLARVLDSRIWAYEGFEPDSLILEHLYELSQPDLAILLREIPIAVLAYATKGVSVEMLDRVESSLDPTRAEELREMRRELGPVPLSKVEKANSEVINELSRLSNQKLISLAPIHLFKERTSLEEAGPFDSAYIQMANIFFTFDDATTRRIVAELDADEIADMLCYVDDGRIIRKILINCPHEVGNMVLQRLQAHYGPEETQESEGEEQDIMKLWLKIDVTQENSARGRKALLHILQVIEEVASTGEIFVC